jgi:hypothetical protein
MTTEIEFHMDAAHREVVRAALRGHEEKLVMALSTRAAEEDHEWRDTLRADRNRTRAMILALDRGR